MANYLKGSMQESVRHFYNNLQWSKRRIARELKIHRRTVSKYINEDSKCTTLTTGSGGRKSLCEPWHDYIKNKPTAQLSA
ncbi:MAG: helix-turn-helix domain-containing protein [Victivallales bacterium]|nr:helix-turn-helix domain-containing protein [Victivallales bacterium]